jgi:hypothetical protein
MARQSELTNQKPCRKPTTKEANHSSDWLKTDGKAERVDQSKVSHKTYNHKRENLADFYQKPYCTNTQ